MDIPHCLSNGAKESGQAQETHSDFLSFDQMVGRRGLFLFIVYAESQVKKRNQEQIPGKKSYHGLSFVCLS